MKWLLSGDYDHDELLNADGLGSASCIALGGGYFVLWSGGESMYWGIPRLLRHTITGGQKSLPKPEYVAIGPQNWYYVKFAAGKSE